MAATIIPEAPPELAGVHVNSGVADDCPRFLANSIDQSGARAP